jgi:DNA-binding NtrC family response regulator
VLETGELMRLGERKVRKVDVRIVAATNADLKRSVEKGEFRQDFYYRLRVMNLELPPVRDRMDDLPRLAEHFLAQISQRLNKRIVGFSRRTLQALQAHSWPGNIRELENTVARAVALATTQVLGPDDFPSLLAAVPAQSAVATTAALDAAPFDRLLALCGLSPHALNENGWDRVLEACERICLEGVLPRYRNQKEAAQALGLTPTKIHRLIRKYRLKQ